jgi:hypothetical protein
LPNTLKKCKRVSNCSSLIRLPLIFWMMLVGYPSVPLSLNGVAI